MIKAALFRFYACQISRYFIHFSLIFSSRPSFIRFLAANKMLAPFASFIVLLNAGFGIAASSCTQDQCYNAVANYCPTTAAQDCSSLLPTTTIYNASTAATTVVSTITLTTTLTEALGGCPLPSPSVMVPLKARQLATNNTATVPTASSIFPQVVYGLPPSSPSPTISVPTYARVAGCVPSAYSSVCSCLFSTNGATVTSYSSVSSKKGLDKAKTCIDS